MERIWQWAWDRYGARYSWVVFAISSLAMLPVWLASALLVVALEQSDRYVEAAAVTVAVVVVMVYMAVLPGVGPSRLFEQWAAGREVDRAPALEATYVWAREAGGGGGGGGGGRGGEGGRWLDRIALGRCRCDRRDDGTAAGSVRDPRRRLRRCLLLDH